MIGPAWKRVFRWASLLAGLVLLGGPGSAAEPGSPPPAARPGVMSRFELRQCLDQQEGLAQREKLLRAQQALLDAEAGALAEEARLLAEQMRALDRQDLKRVDNYNRDLADHNNSVHKYNEGIELLGREFDALNDDTAKVTARCATRLYSRDDRDAILEERKAQGAAP